MELQELVSGLLGPAVPLIVQLIRNHWKRELSSLQVHLLALVVTGVAVGAAYASGTPHPTLSGYLSNLGVAFTLSQQTYRLFEQQLKSG